MKKNNYSQPYSIPKNIKKKKRSSVGKTILVIFLIIILAIAATAAYVWFFHKPTNNPSDETLPFDTEPQTPSTKTKDETDSPETKEPEEPEDPKNSETFNFLLLGKDQVALNTDVFMLMNFNVKTGKITVMQIPRDTYYEENGVGYKINMLYANYYMEGQSKNEDPVKYGMEHLVSTLEKNLCLNIHYYAIVNVQGFRNIVDILGGVPVDVPADMKYFDKEQDLYIDLKKGYQLLDGDKAEQFVRFRSGYVTADIGRLDAQKIFGAALIKRVKENFNVSTIAQLVNECIKNVTTDIGVADCVYFAKNLLSVDMSNINFMTMPGYDAREFGDSGLWYYVMYRNNMREIINKYFNIYDFEINDATFDKNRVFTSKTKQHIDLIYTKKEDISIEDILKSAAEIDKKSIDIPRI